MKTTIVLVCHGNTVLDLGILSVLRTAQSLIVFQTSSDNLAQLLREVEINHPDVVILSQDSKIAWHSLYGSLHTIVPAVHLLTICSASNHICINQDQIVQIQRASDIIQLILDKAYLT